MRRLVVSGPGKKDATVTFRSGLNVVVGPSDTGKTYIFQCLDFALGSSTPPKNIPQSGGYETVELSLVAHTGREYILTRSLRGGDISLQEEGAETRAMKRKHSPENSDNVSTFLLELSGFFGRRVRTKADGTTRGVSFRDIAHLAFVDEASVMDPRSPARSGQFTTQTVESRVLRLVLTGEDDSSIVAQESPKMTKARRDERATLLETLIARNRSAHSDRLESPDAVKRELSQLRRQADEASAQLTEMQEAATELEGRRRTLWSELRTRQSRADVLRELQSRFELLGEQYESDLRRLAAIAEVGLRIDQTPEERCPVCGALAEDQQHDHVAAEESPAAIRLSCEAEAAKIATLVVDLSGTLEVNGRELADAEDEVRAQAAELAGLDEGFE
jgi:DNA repair exonuclease SbcCD ATPase subunit